MTVGAVSVIARNEAIQRPVVIAGLTRNRQYSLPYRRLRVKPAMTVCFAPLDMTLPFVILPFCKNHLVTFSQ
jgi:hypothetical protein